MTALGRTRTFIHNSTLVGDIHLGSASMLGIMMTIIDQKWTLRKNKCAA